MGTDKIQIAIEALKERREELLEEIKGIDSSIRALGGAWNKEISTKISKSPVEYEDKNYKPDWSIKKKFAYLLKKHNRFLHFREAAEMVNSLEKNEYDLGDLASKLSSGTQSLKSNGTLVKYKVNANNRNTFWGYKDWIDDNGNILKGYEYNKEYVFNAGDSREDLFNDI